MLNEQTFEKLYAMKLVGMAEALKDQMGRTDMDELTFEERFGNHAAAGGREDDRHAHVRRGGRPVPLVPAGFSYAGPPDKPESIALRFGADDIDGTIVEERIYHDAGATTTQGLRRAELLHLIRKAGLEPVERDTLYRPVERTEATFTVLV